MTQLLKHKSVIMCVLNAERRICFFWSLIVHWVTTTPTPTSIVPIDFVGAGLAKNEPCARLPSSPPVLSSHKQIHKDLTFRRNQSRPALQIALESAQVSHQLPQSGFCMPVVPSAAWLTYVAPLAVFFAVHTHHALKSLSNSGPNTS